MPRMQTKRTIISGEFGKCAVALREILYQDRPLTEAEFLFMDNHFQVLGMAYFARNESIIGRQISIECDV